MQQLHFTLPTQIGNEKDAFSYDGGGAMVDQVSDC